MKKGLNKDTYDNKDMGLLGRGLGYLGLPLRYSSRIRLIVIWVFFGGATIYFLLQKNFNLAGISFGVGLLFTGLEKMS